MKVEFSDNTFFIEAENDIEKCALQYLGDRPPKELTVNIPYVGAFVRFHEQTLIDIVKEHWGFHDWDPLVKEA